MRQDNTQEQLKDLLQETKNYVGLQKEYIKLTLAEQLTHLLSKIAVAVVGIFVVLLVILFLGLALVHWIGDAIGNIGLCYAIFALLMALMFIVFYLNRRRCVILPLARIMSQTFLLNAEEEQEEKEETDDERAE